MARISTGTGDDGTTGLVGGRRIAKTALRVEAVGAVDEANDALGVAAALTPNEELRTLLRTLQSDLFTLGADLAAPELVSSMRILPEHVARLEQESDRLEAALPPLRNFILPGGAPSAAALQVARSIVRRAERAAWRAHADETLGEAALVYLNRLSDLLFLLAREENAKAGVAEPVWAGKGP